ncbi:DUF4166 domain-containing protein [Armatimonas sp.]|uniref:DUF4166 domain-containing protein n=1 Tax=Armatimonas sp. TaxID=1872638 RepID=UPI00374CC873
MCLYRRALGTTFDCLPPVLQAFHQSSGGNGMRAVAHGHMQITHGSGRFRRTLAVFLRLPQAGESVPVTLRIESHGEKERWVRQLGRQQLVTWQSLGQNGLVESVGPLRFGFQLDADTEGMRFISRKCWLLGVPLPPVLAPRVTAQVRGAAQSWWLKVCLDVPGVGRLLSYEGELRPA